jgi:lactoylglutathione lyase
MAKAIHMMVRVLDLDRSIAFYEKALQLRVADRFDFETFTLVYLRNDEADFEVELTFNKGRTEAYAPGDGYGHMAFCVDDLDAEHRRCAAAGLAPEKIVAFERDGTLMARFFFLTDPDGYRIELLQRHGRYR